MSWASRGSQRVAVGGAIAALALSPTAAAQDRVFQGLGDVPGGYFYSEAHAVSADGSVVVGESADAFRYPAFHVVAFRWTRGEGTQSLGRLPDPAYYDSSARAVSSDGSVVVGESTRNAEEYFITDAFMWTPDGGLVGLGGAGGLTGSLATAVSPDGTTIYGQSELVQGDVRASLWNIEHEWQPIAEQPPEYFGSAAMASSADGRVVAGWMWTIGIHPAFVWTQAEGFHFLGYLPGGEALAIPSAISADGSAVVGRAHSGNNTSINDFEAFRWTAGQGIVGLGDLPGGSFLSEALAVSPDGARVYGRTSTTLPGGGAFVWDERHGMRSIYPILVNDFGLDLTGWRLLYVSGVSADERTLVGTGINPSGQIEGWIAYLGPPCPADFNHDFALNSQDFFDYLIAFFAGGESADFNHDSGVTSQDFFDFLNAFFAGC